jgi:hypothetical protein
MIKPTEYDMRQIAQTVNAFWKNMYGPTEYRKSEFYKQDRARLARLRAMVKIINDTGELDGI